MMYPVYRIRPYKKDGLGFNDYVYWRVQVKHSWFSFWVNLYNGCDTTMQAAEKMNNYVSRGGHAT